MSLRVFEPGPRTTFQDLGRPGWASHGVPASGAFDPFALRAANRLVGNDDAAACLEFTLVGPTLRVERDVTVAVVGSTLEPRAIRLKLGHTWRAGKATAARGYIAVAGGFAVPPVMGSRSTNLNARIGPAPPAAGDVLAVGSSDARPDRRLQGRADTGGEVRVVPGLHAPALADDLARLAGSFSVSSRADRTGVRLAEPLGVAIDARAFEVPVGVAPGTVQLPSDGHPIVIGPDGPVTGGYTQIAQVIAADLGVIGQAKPGDTLTFVTVTVEQAREAYRERMDDLLGRIVEAS